MQIDSTTLKDLSILNGEINIFSLINLTTSSFGAEKLRNHLKQPPESFEKLLEVQAAVKYWERHIDEWDTVISNGTLIMLKDFFEAADGLHYKPSSWMFAIDAALQKIFNKNAYSLLQFSVHNLIDLVHGLHQLVSIKDTAEPLFIKEAKQEMLTFLEHPIAQELLKLNKQSSLRALMHAGYHARRKLKKYISKVFEAFAKMDAWHSMAKAGLNMGFTMPEILNSEKIILNATGLFHPLLKKPVAYDIVLDDEKNMLFLTGANMSGKSTLLRSLGISSLLAHTGMAVPASKMTISYLDGIVTNMQVEDNIFKGESYFFAEVQRMKITAQKIHQNKRLLLLMDELFKGTNVHDAYECSKAVIQHLIVNKQNLMAISTHLYELYDTLKTEKSILFKYCNTILNEKDAYQFTYELKDGVSNDKIGYLVLKHEGVLDILKQNNNSI